MTTDRQITCITTKEIAAVKHDFHIQSVGGDWGSDRVSVVDVVVQIKYENYNYFVNVDGKRADVIVKDLHGVFYITTAADDTLVNNLLELPACT